MHDVSFCLMLNYISVSFEQLSPDLHVTRTKPVSNWAPTFMLPETSQSATEPRPSCYPNQASQQLSPDLHVTRSKPVSNWAPTFMLPEPSQSATEPRPSCYPNQASQQLSPDLHVTRTKPVSNWAPTFMLPEPNQSATEPRPSCYPNQASQQLSPDLHVTRTKPVSNWAPTFMLPEPSQSATEPRPSCYSNQASQQLSPDLHVTRTKPVSSWAPTFMLPEPSQSATEPCHEVMVPFVLRKLILQTGMRSRPMGLDVWILVGPFIYFRTLCVRTAKALASLRGCAGSPEPTLDEYVISTIIPWAGSFSLEMIEFYYCEKEPSVQTISVWSNLYLYFYEQHIQFSLILFYEFKTVFQVKYKQFSIARKTFFTSSGK